MNLLEKLNSELKDKHYNDLEKMRYIYLRTCELFSYDETYYTSLALNNEKLHQEIRNSYFDITNIDKFKVICYTYANILSN